MICTHQLIKSVCAGSSPNPVANTEPTG